MVNEYAMVESSLVTNVVLWDGVLPDSQEATGEAADSDGLVVTENSLGVTINAWQPPQGVLMVRITEETGPAAIGGTWDGVKFTMPVAPPAPPAPPPTVGQVLQQRDVLLALATLRIAPLQDAVDLDEATADELALLKLWKKYRVDLSRIEQQAGFHLDVVWPSQPS